jgi:hypothetical protein
MGVAAFRRPADTFVGKSAVIADESSAGVWDHLIITGFRRATEM